MPRTIQQTVRFAAPPARVFDLYADSRLHAAATGAPARIPARAGGSMTAGGGYIKGKVLLARRPRLIVQTWRASDWAPSEQDSLLILIFGKARGGTELRMVHANVPDARFTTIAQGWKAYYWTPWTKYLSRGATRPAAKAAKGGRRRTEPTAPKRARR